ASARPAHTAGGVEGAGDAGWETFRREGPKDAEVDRAGASIGRVLVQGLESHGGSGGVADRLNMYNHFLHDPGYLASDLARYQAVTPASVRQFASSQLGKNARVVIHCVPGKQDLGTPVPTPAPVASKPGEGAESTNPDAEWRNQQPEAGAARPFPLAAPQPLLL